MATVRPIAALTWRDWRRITHTEHTQLVVNKKRLANGEIEWQTDEDNCRLIPIADLLSEVLEKQKESISPGNDPIVSTVKSPLTAIREQIRAAELYAGIAPDLISVPDSNKQVDLNQYGGSRMRENFERHCYVDCCMTDAEVHHLILRKMPDTLSKNYVDYGHECIQERMAVKLNQWTQRFQRNETGWKTQKLTKQGVSLKTRGNQTEVYNLTVQTDSLLRIIAECDHDYELRLLVRSKEAET